MLATDFAIPPKYWNKKSSRVSKDIPSEYGNVEKLKSLLTEKLRKAGDMVSEANKRKICPINFLKANFPLSDQWEIAHLKENKNDLDVYQNIDLYIQ